MKLVHLLYLISFIGYSCSDTNIESNQIGTGIEVTNSKTLIENFESDTYKLWTISGNAFSVNMAPESQLKSWGVKGYEGNKRMCSYWPNGDSAKGRMKSPSFVIDKDYFNFLVGGGGDFENTYVALYIDGKEFKREAGCNDFNMEQVSWNVSDYKGKTAYIIANDSADHAWGFIQFDYIYLSDKPAQWRKSKLVNITSNYLNFPVSYTDNIENIRLYCGEEVVYDLDLRLTDKNPDYWVSLDCSDLKGKDIDISVMYNSFIDAKTPLVYNAGLSNISQSDVPVDKGVFYKDALRPKAHFSAARGWLNDPNGLYYYNGTWHISYQHNPFGSDWGNIHWGHAYGTDLYHWTETNDILKPDKLGVPFSGYSIIDFNNILGFQKGSDPTIVSYYTSAGENGYLSRNQLYSQCMAYSNDGGWTWKRYDKNPVVPYFTTNTRDPHVVWNDEDKKWVMVVYLYDNLFAFFESTNLIDWTLTGDITIPNDIECPDLYKIKVEETGEYYWVLSAVHNIYYVGNFLGGKFVPITSAKSQDLNREYLAPHTFTNAPNGRRIQVGCIGNGNFPNLPFNQAFSFPKELSLHTCSDGYRLHAKPCEEIKNGYDKNNIINENNLVLSSSSKKSLTGGAFHAKAVIDLNKSNSTSFGFRMDDMVFTYDRLSGSFNVSGGYLTQSYNALSTKPLDGKVEIEVIYDCSILEVFVNGGEYSLTATFTDRIANKYISTISNGGDTYANSLVIAELKPFWE